MIRKIREAQEREEGFTLIELLVVVIIIGILAAIAIPAFLNQRESARQADLTSAVRNYALEIEANGTMNNGVYPAADATGLPTGVADPSNNADVAFVYAPIGTAPNFTGFTLCGEHALITSTVHNVTYDTTANGMQGFDDSAGC